MTGARKSGLWEQTKTIAKKESEPDQLVLAAAHPQLFRVPQLAFAVRVRPHPGELVLPLITVGGKD